MRGAVIVMRDLDHVLVYLGLVAFAVGLLWGLALCRWGLICGG